MKQGPPIPDNEVQRVTALHSLCLLDTPADPEFDLITRLAAKTFNVPISVISLVDEGRQWFKSKVGIETQETPRKDAFCAYAILSPLPMIVLDAQDDERFSRNPLVTAAPYIRFYAGAPLVTKEGMNLGTLCIIDNKPRARFTAAEQGILTNLCALVLTRIETLRAIGYVDPVTLLPNRARFIEDIQLRLANPAPGHGNTDNRHQVAIAVDVCGGDYLHDMVKALGWEHAEGYLVEAKNNLVNAVAPALVYRVGTTLFAFMQDVATSIALAPAFFDIPAAFSGSINYRGIPHAADISIGAVHLKDQNDAKNVLRSLITSADIARHQGINCCIYERNHDEAQRRSFHILASLPQALGVKNQLSLHYQPRLQLSTGKCVGVEALLRWNHPELGNLAPSEFVPLAEKTALVRRLTQWVLHEGFSQAAHWQKSGHDFTVALNVSAVDLDHLQFVGLLRDLLSRYDINPEKIEIEFTESAMSLHPQRLHEHLQHIRALGFQIAIDDFGTGYSNLTYLKRIPATTLKIDQSFIRSLPTDTRDCTIVPALIHLGHELGHCVVAEGIESQEIYKMVEKWGCDEGQGYSIARPMPPDLLEKWLIAEGSGN